MLKRYTYIQVDLNQLKANNTISQLELSVKQYAASFIETMSPISDLFLTCEIDVHQVLSLKKKKEFNSLLTVFNETAELTIQKHQQVSTMLVTFPRVTWLEKQTIGRSYGCS